MGRAARDTGHRRLPTPPESKTGISMSLVQGDIRGRDATGSTVSRHLSDSVDCTATLHAGPDAPSPPLDQERTFLYNCGVSLDLCAAISNSRSHRPLSPHWNPDRMTDATPFLPQSHYDKADLVACGMGELFGAGNAQLPIENMLMVDRINHISSEGGAAGKGELIAELDIHPDLWFFACHFPGDPVMPGCLGLDAMWQLVGFFLGWRGNPGRGRALGCGEVKFTGQILPDHKQVRYHIHMKRVIERKLVMGIADGSVAVDGEVIYTASDLRVGLFQNTESM